MLDRLRSLSGLELLRINPALARDQVAALAQQLPLLYAILLVNALALSVTHLGVAPATMTLVAPGVLCAACAWRALAWTRITIADMTDAAAVGRLRTTTWLTVLFAIAFAWWSAGLYPYGSVYAQFHVVF
jgi:predicted signal transduction protein with EAL and GGDEF domain